ncbi:MAG: type III secretion system chaperone [Mailhella sp.]|nr:type III secretion system chaperone [Mailhella sp.]
MDFDALIAELGRNIGLEGLAFENDGTCSVFFDEDEVFFEKHGGKLLFIAPLAPRKGRRICTGPSLRPTSSAEAPPWAPSASILTRTDSSSPACWKAMKTMRILNGPCSFSSAACANGSRSSSRAACPAPFLPCPPAARFSPERKAPGQGAMYRK